MTVEKGNIAACYWNSIFKYFKVSETQNTIMHYVRWIIKAEIKNPQEKIKKEVWVLEKTHSGDHLGTN